MPKPRAPEETYGPSLEKAQQAFPQLDPDEVAARAGVSYAASTPDSGRFLVPFMNTLYDVEWPGGTVRRATDRQPAAVTTQILVLHYLLTADGSPLVDRWIAFRNLPGGLGYDAAFTRRANLRLAGAFGADRAAFEHAARTLSGERLGFGDASFMFRVFPRVWLGVVLYLADEEFPAGANVLFDASASHYLPTEDLAVLGGLVAGLLTKSARAH
jgi:hypothetical protein